MIGKKDNDSILPKIVLLERGDNYSNLGIDDCDLLIMPSDSIAKHLGIRIEWRHLYFGRVNSAF